MILIHAQVCESLIGQPNFSSPCFLVLHHLLEIAQTRVHQVGDAIQPSCPLLSPSLPAFNLSQHQGLFHSVGSSHQVAKVLEEFRTRKLVSTRPVIFMIISGHSSRFTLSVSSLLLSLSSPSVAEKCGSFPLGHLFSSLPYG